MTPDERQGYRLGFRHLPMYEQDSIVRTEMGGTIPGRNGRAQRRRADYIDRLWRYLDQKPELEEGFARVVMAHVESRKFRRGRR